MKKSIYINVFLFITIFQCDLYTIRLYIQLLFFCLRHSPRFPTSVTPSLLNQQQQ